MTAEDMSGANSCTMPTDDVAIDGPGRNSVADPEVVVRQLRKGSLRGLSSADLLASAGSSPVQFNNGLSAYYHQAIAGITRDVRKGVNDDDLDTLKATSSAAPPSLEYVRASLELYKFAGLHGLEDVLAEASSGDLESALLHHVAFNAEQFGSGPGLVASSMLLGKVNSLHDRAKSAEYFRRMKEADEFELTTKTFMGDLGAHTYVARNELSEAEARSRTTGVHDSMIDLTGRPPQARAAVVISVDPRYFRVFAPAILYYAQQFSAIDFNVILCASVDEAGKYAERASEFIRAMDRLNGAGQGLNLHFWASPVPSFVTTPRTFSASARFYAVPVMLERYSNVHILDADLTIEADLHPYLESIRKVSFGAIATGGFRWLSPWRRYLAGNVAFSRDVKDQTMDDLQNYLSWGLSVETSWMLDQNALAFAIEADDAHFENLDKYKSPLYQRPVRNIWKRNSRAR